MASCFTCKKIFTCFHSELHDDIGHDDKDSPIAILSHRKTETVECVLKEDSPEKTEVVCVVSKLFNQKNPPKPLSVMEINELLNRDHLEEAYPHLLSLRLKFQREQDETTSFLESDEKKNLSRLYETLRTKVIDIIRQSSSLSSCNKKLLEFVANIIKVEENIEDVGGLKSWRDVWMSAVENGVRDKIMGVQLDSREENNSWLAVHLAHLGKAIVELLEKVKTELVNSYPPSFNVFETYVSFCQKIVREHLNELPGKITELKDYYAMLNFIINQYEGEKILGSPTLQPEMKKMRAFKFPDDFVNRMKDGYCDCQQEELNSLLSNMIKVEKEDLWMKKDMPKDKEDGKFIISEIHIDICKLIASYADNSGKIDESLKKRVLSTCLEALKHFPNRFMEEFTKQSSTLLSEDILDCCLYCKYHVVYANSFSSLKDHVEIYKESFPDQVAELERALDGLLLSLRQALLKQFRVETESYMKNMMIKKWLKTNDDFKEIKNRLETYSGFSTSMRPRAAQSYANDLHYHVVKEYITQLLKKEYSCKGKKNKSAAEKIRDQWDDFNGLFSEMGSTLKWLHSLGFQLSNIIEQENERDINNLLEPFLKKYPDISEKQLLAILYFRNNNVVGKAKLLLKKNTVIQHFNVLKENCEKNPKHTLFSDINVKSK